MQISDYIAFNIIKCLQFLDLTHFRGQGRNLSNNFVAFLENLRHHIFVLRLSDLYQEATWNKFLIDQRERIPPHCYQCYIQARRHYNFQAKRLRSPCTIVPMNAALLGQISCQLRGWVTRKASVRPNVEIQDAQVNEPQLHKQTVLDLFSFHGIFGKLLTDNMVFLVNF